MPLTKAQIGRLGELLVQSRLLELGIDSAPTTTDTGIDLLALTPKGAMAIQVKTNYKPKRAGGKGIFWVDWWIPKDTNVKTLLAFVRYDTRQIWLMTMPELVKKAQQGNKPKNKFYHFGMAVEPTKSGISHQHDQEKYSQFLFEIRCKKLFA